MIRKDLVSLNAKEQRRLKVISEVEAGRLAAVEAAQALGLSLRQVRRLRASLEEEGAGAFMHGNRGRSSQHRLSDELRYHVASLGAGVYAGCNDSHMRELLALREGIILSRASVQRIRRQAGQRPKQRRRPPIHRSRRDRMPQEGMLLQIDGSSHHWFGPDYPRCTLLGAIDDATGNVVAANFREQEDAQGYMLLLRQVLTTQGIPLDLYHDRHSVFQRNSKDPWSVAEQLRGRPDPTQFGHALAELGIGSIAAHSPEAKGRIERLWRSFQDRLVFELELAGITDMKAAGRFLPGFLKRYNDRFAIEAPEPGRAYRPIDQALDLDRILSFRYQRMVARDNTVRLGGRLTQIPPGPKQRSYAGVRVWLHEFLDGSVGVWYQDRWLTRGGSGSPDVKLRARNRTPERPEKPIPLPLVEPRGASLPGTPMPPWKPAANHPWRTPARGQNH